MKKKRDLKHYERVDSIFSCTSSAAPITQPGTTRIHNRGTKYRTVSCIYEILNSFVDTLKWSHTVRRTPKIERAKLHIFLE